MTDRRASCRGTGSAAPPINDESCISGVPIDMFVNPTSRPMWSVTRDAGRRMGEVSPGEAPPGELPAKEVGVSESSAELSLKSDMYGAWGGSRLHVDAKVPDEVGLGDTGFERS